MGMISVMHMHVIRGEGGGDTVWNNRILYAESNYSLLYVIAELNFLHKMVSCNLRVINFEGRDFSTGYFFKMVKSIVQL